MDNVSAAGRASLGRALARGFRSAYDHLGYVVFSTVAVFVVIAGLVGLFALIMGDARVVPLIVTLPYLLLTALAGWICAVGVFYYVNRSVYNCHPVPGDTAAGALKLLLPAVGLFILDIVITAVLVGDMVFFLGMYLQGHNLAALAAGVLFGYLSLFWLMMSMYHLPLLPAQLEMDSGPKPFVIVYKSFLLTAGNPGFTLGLFAVIIALAVLCVIPAGIGMAVVYLGVCAFILTCALRELFVKYGIVEEEPETVDDTPWKLPES